MLPLGHVCVGWYGGIMTDELICNGNWKCVNVTVAHPIDGLMLKVGGHGASSYLQWNSQHSGQRQTLVL